MALTHLPGPERQAGACHQGQGEAKGPGVEGPQGLGCAPRAIQARQPCLAASPPLPLESRASLTCAPPQVCPSLSRPDRTVLQVLASSPTLPGGTLRSTSYVGHPLTEGRAWKASAKQLCPLGSRNTPSPLGSGQLSLSQTREAKDRGRRQVQMDTVIGSRGPGAGGRRGH